MKKNLLTLSTGMLLGALIAVFVPGNMQVTMAQGRTTSINAEIIPLVSALEKEVSDEDHDTVASEVTEEKAEVIAVDEVEAEVHEGVSEELESYNPNFINKDEQSLVRLYNSYRMEMRLHTVEVDEELVLRASGYNASLVRGDRQNGYGEEPGLVYSGIQTGEAASYSASSVIAYWASTLEGQAAVLNTSFTKIGVSVQKLDKELYYTIILL